MNPFAEHLINFKHLIERILDETQGAAPLPALEATGLCHMLAQYPEGQISTPIGPLSYYVLYMLHPRTVWLGPWGVWNDTRYEFLWLVAELSDKEWLELFV